MNAFPYLKLTFYFDSHEQMNNVIGEYIKNINKNEYIIENPVLNNVIYSTNVLFTLKTLMPPKISGRVNIKNGKYVVVINIRPIYLFLLLFIALPIFLSIYSYSILFTLILMSFILLTIFISILSYNYLVNKNYSYLINLKRIK